MSAAALFAASKKVEPARRSNYVNGGFSCSACAAAAAKLSRSVLLGNYQLIRARAFPCALARETRRGRLFKVVLRGACTCMNQLSFSSPFFELRGTSFRKRNCSAPRRQTSSTAFRSFPRRYLSRYCICRSTTSFSGEKDVARNVSYPRPLNPFPSLLSVLICPFPYGANN